MRVFRLLAGVSMVVAAGYSCSLSRSAASLPQAGGSVSIATTGGCSGTSVSAGWLSVVQAGANFTITAAANQTSSTRYGSARIGTQSVTVVQVGVTAPKATASIVGTPRTIAIVGDPSPEAVLATVSDAVITITPTTLPSFARATITAEFSHEIAGDAMHNALPHRALLVANGAGDPGRPILQMGVNAFFADSADSRTLRWNNVPAGALQSSAVGGELKLRITGIRLALTKAAAPTVSIRIVSDAPLSLTNPNVPLTLASLAPFPVVTIGAAVQGPEAGTFLIPVTITERSANTFRATSGDKVGTRFRLFANGLEFFARVLSASGNAQTVGADVFFGAGGTFTDGEALFGGRYLRTFGATWEVKSASDSAVDSLVLTVLVTAADKAAADQFAQQLTVLAAPNPFPNDIPISDADIELSASAPAIVRGNRRITINVANLSPDPPPETGLGTPIVTVRGNAGVGYRVAGCTVTAEDSCDTFSTSVQVPGESSVPVQVDLVALADLPDGAYSESTILAEVNTNDPDMTNNRAVSGAVNQSCAPLFPVSGAFGAAGGSGSVSVPNCFIWSAESLTSWINVTAPISETYEPGTAAYIVSPNTSTSERTGRLRIAEAEYTVVQRGACTFQFDPASLAAPGAGLSASVRIITAANCPSTISAPSWVTVSPASGTGPRNVIVTVASTGAARSGNATVRETGLVGGPAATLPISQSAPVCSMSSTPERLEIGPGGGTGTFQVIAAGGGCSWSVGANQSWLTMTPASGTLSATVTYTAAANAGPALRTATIELRQAGQLADSITAVQYGPAPGDFDRNGRPDVIWQNDAQRNSTVWHMGGPDGTALLEFCLLSGPNPGWRIVRSGDFNGDGRPDVLWQQEATRQLTVWYMGGAKGCTLLDFKLLSVGVGGWRVVGSGDFNGDGQSDLVWQNDATRQLTVWYLGPAPMHTFLKYNFLPSAPSPWRVVAVTDFNRDGKPDLLWQNDTTRHTTVWFLGGAEGTVFTGWNALSGPVPGWRVIGTSDADGDGNLDLLWQNEGSRAVTVWYLGGAPGYAFTRYAFLTQGIAGWTAIE